MFAGGAHVALRPRLAHLAKNQAANPRVDLCTNHSPRQNQGKMSKNAQHGYQLALRLAEVVSSPRLPVVI